MDNEIERKNVFNNEFPKKLAKKYCYPEWMITRFLYFIPDTEMLLRYIEDIHSNTSNNFDYIRTNTLKIDPDSLKKRLYEKGYTLKNTILKEVFKIEKNSDIKLPSLGSTLEYLKGYYYIQDLSSCIAVEELEINESCQTVLDLAASPGGKTTFIAQKMNNKGNIIACEPNTKRISSLIFNLSRCNVRNAMVFNTLGEDIGRLGMDFDRILLDAPCSCEGIIAKDQSRKTSRIYKDIEICSIKQKKLIKSALNVLKSDGIMIYCTCSFAPEENEMIIDYILNNNNEAVIEIEPVKYGINGLTEFNNYKFDKKIKKTKRLYPHIHNTNGFFIAKLKKINK
ncbi:MAG: NOL1/NOP2/sun family putative RNA methylase [Candidatus Nitrosocosmicus sp.]